jgi:hypothetical protein
MKGLTLLFCTLVCLGPQATQVRESAGKQEVEKHQLVLEPPAPLQTQRLDPVKLREEADELAKLAQLVPQDMGQVARGKLPKDAIDRLRRIEKISKHLRSELAP